MAALADCRDSRFSFSEATLAVGEADAAEVRLRLGVVRTAGATRRFFALGSSFLADFFSGLPDDFLGDFVADVFGDLMADGFLGAIFVFTCPVS